MPNSFNNHVYHNKKVNELFISFDHRYIVSVVITLSILFASISETFLL